MTEATLLKIIELGRDVEAHFRTTDKDINSLCSTGCTFLSWAVRKGSLETINYLIEQGADVNRREKNGGSPLLIAVYLDRLDVVECLIKHGAKMNYTDSLGRTPLIVAVQGGNLDIIEFLLDHDANVGCLDMKKFSALRWATRNDEVKIFDLLLHKTENNMRKPFLLCAAAGDGSIGVVEFLLKHEVDVNASFNGETALRHAAAKGHLDIVKMLISNGANVNELDSQGNTPLALAVAYKQTEVVKYLTEMSNVCKVGEQGKTPLYWAVRNEDLEIVEWLLDHGSEYIIDTVFLDAIALQNLNLVRLLVERGALVNGTSPKDVENNGIKMTPLMKSFDVKSVEITRFLIENGAKIGTNLRTKMRRSPLLSAVRNQDLDMVKLILGHGVEEPSETVFLEAIQLKNLEMVQLLKEKGAVINPLRNSEASNTSVKITPLMKSFEVGSLEIARYLIENGAEIDDDYGKATGRTPLLCAVEKQDFDMVKLILERGEKYTDDGVFLKAIETKNFKIVQLLNESEAFINTGNDKMNDNETPLMKALDAESIEIAQYLIGNGAKVVDDLGKNEITYIMKFLEKRNFQMVKLLTENGARLDVTSDCGNTVLIKAIQIEDSEMVKYFVEHHADVNQANKAHLTPLDAAVANHDFRIFQYLVDFGAKVHPHQQDQVKRYYQVAKRRCLRTENPLFETSSNQEEEK